MNSNGGHTFRDGNGYLIKEALSWNATEQMMMNAMETRIKDYEQVWLSNDNYQLTPDFLMTRICFMKLIRTRALVRLDIDI